MDPVLAMILLSIGLVMLIFGIGGKVVIRMPGFGFVGALGALITLIGVAGLSGWI